MNITRLNRRDCSLNMKGCSFAYKLTGNKTSCSRKYNDSAGSVYDITHHKAQKKLRYISNPSIKMDKLGLN